MSCDTGCRHSSDLTWLWHRLAAKAPIGPLAWEPAHASSVALKRQKKKKKKERKKEKKKERMKKKIWPSKRCVYVLIPGTSDCYLIWKKRVFSDIFKLRILKWKLILDDPVGAKSDEKWPYKRYTACLTERIWRVHVTSEAHVGEMVSLAKKCWSHQELEEVRIRIFPLAFGGSEALPHLDFGFLASRLRC